MAMASDRPGSAQALRVTLSSALLAVAGPAGAQALLVQPEVESTVTMTNNASATPAEEARSDTIISVNPRIHITSRGGRATLEGTFGVEAVKYINGTEDSVVRPRGSLGLRSQLVDRLLYLDASVVADTVSADPYAARPDTAASYNDYTQLRYRFTPYIERQLTPTLSLLARSDHVITRRVGSSSASDPGGTDPARDAHEQQQTLRLEQMPRPFGWTAELTRDSSRLRGADDPTLTQTAARLIGNYAVDPQLTLGVSLGRENSKYSTIDRDDSIAGVRVNWRPNERGEVNLGLESRYFGVGGDFEWRQRSPYLGFALRANRQPVAQSGSHLLGAAGDNVSSLLDGILTTRYPDAAQRATVVNDLIRQLNLPGTLVGPLELYTSYAQLQSNVSLTGFLYGRLTTASATVFMRKRVRLVDLEDVLAPAALDSDNLQSGAEVDVSRRLTAVLSADAGLRYARVKGLGASAGQQSRDATIRFGLTRQVTPTTRVSAGLRYQSVNSTVTNPSSETAIVASLLHRF